MIKAHVTDVRALAARTPNELSIYLRSAGWAPGDHDGTTTVWTRSAGEDGTFEVRQPMDPALRDYAARVGDIIRTLAVAEDRSEIDVLRAISESSQDVCSVRIFPPNAPAGQIPLDDSVSVYESMRALVVSCAYPVVARRYQLVQPTRKPQELVDYLRTVRIGPAVEGSYALSVHTDIPPPLHPDQPKLSGLDDDVFGVDDAPLGRRVSLRIYHAVRSAHRAAVTALATQDGLSSFTSAVESGVSANLCEALAGLGGVNGHSFEISLALAAVRSHPGVFEPVRFRREQLPILQEAARQLRAQTPEEDVVLTGVVIRLHRETDGDGEVTVMADVEGLGVRKVRMMLASEDYSLAVRAHDEERDVCVRGDLVRRGKRFVLQRPYGFTALARDDT